MEENTKKRNSKILTISVAVLFAVMVIVVAQYFYNRVFYVYTDDASVQQNMVPVHSRVGGYIETINFDEFSIVKKGDTLLTIDPADYQIQLNQAEAGLEDALANKMVLTSTIATLENAQIIAKANLAETEARLWNAEQNYKRFEQLVKEKSATKQHFDQVKTEFESLKARYTAMKQGAEGAKLATIEAKTRLKAVDANIKRAEAGVDFAKQNLDYTVVIAPCDGITGRKTINANQLVQGGQVLVQIIDNDEKWITANFLEKQAEELKIGTDVKISVDAFPGYELSGIVQSISGATGSVFSLVPVDNATGNFVKVQQRIPVRIGFDKETSIKLLADLRAGMNAEIFVEN